jgi:hypothetical protein
MMLQRRGKREKIGRDLIRNSVIIDVVSADPTDGVVSSYTSNALSGNMLRDRIRTCLD